MKILSIDACTDIISLALVNGDNIEEKHFPSGKEYSEKILPEIKKLLNKKKLKINDIDAIAFGAGPGAFTGIRISCGIAYGIAYSNNLPIVGINTLEALALLSEYKYSISCIDARMGQVYLGIYENKNRIVTPLIEPGLFDPSNLPKIPKIKEAIVIGSGLNFYKEELKNHFSNIKLEYFKKKCSLAVPIGFLAMGQFGNKFNLKNASPIYIRNKVALTTEERLGHK